MVVFFCLIGKCLLTGRGLLDVGEMVFLRLVWVGVFDKIHSFAINISYGSIYDGSFV